MMRSSNPTLTGSAFRDAYGTAVRQDQTMTLDGTVNKTGIMLLLVVAGAAYSWSADSGFLMYFGMFGGLIAALATVFRPHWSMYTAPAYALLEGLFLGTVSAFFEGMYPGIVKLAVTLTFGVAFSVLMLYRSGIIKPTENFKLIVVGATGGIAVTYMITWILGFFGITVGLIHGNGLFGIGFSLFVVAIAALNLVMDFDFIEEAAERQAPKYMEWYGAFSLMVTLIWLYIEVLRLLAKLQSRD